MKRQRSSGVLAHITSLPSAHGIGDIGESAIRFLDFLVAAEQSVWQFLPTVPTDGHFDHSPYMSSSAFAGNPLLISPQSLLEDGFVSADDLKNHQPFSPFFVEFDRVVEFKQKLISIAAANFQWADSPCRTFIEEFEAFCRKTKWLRDYALFMTAKEVFEHRPWNQWPADIARRDKKALDAFASEFRDRITFYNVEQFLFALQWKRLREAAEARGIQLFGDIPLYVSGDSVDVWANPNIFALDRDSGEPIDVAGVPPDYFAETGQRWGNPLYDWQSKSPAIRKKIYDWWAARLAHAFELVHLSRIDHFRGFESYWAIPKDETTAVNGRWMRGPGVRFFEAMEKRLGRLDIIAEDLGEITPEVRELLAKTGFAGMKVLLFAFDGDPANTFLPHNYRDSNCVVYTGTHDNSTTVGWYFAKECSDQQRQQLKRYVNGSVDDGHQIHHDMIFLAHSSVAAMAIIPLQDLLGFGNDCRMNTPGVATGNWKWQCAAKYLDDALASFLRETTLRFNRGRSLPQQEA